ncbi:MAG: recombination mediator RecR [Alphaproteobacteria bacterium]|jgi:recombination protein RecR|nr:recombination mediator RecR [Hyphomicrobiales bacterium]|tara:strand:+ start:46096 stop:46701 length:606 start_codon:yes stop_codon:yes gene_type:complete
MKSSVGPEIETFIKLLSKLPGLGPRSARRAALTIIKKRNQLLDPLKKSFIEISEKIETCDICDNVDVINPCSICQDLKRDSTIICVVEEVSDLWALERANAINCHYHVLGGVLNALDGIGPEELNIKKLISRVNNTDIKEVILALNATIDGQATIHVVSELISNRNIKITKVAHGVPVGGELDYLDDGTLSQAIAARSITD